jgi:hypothetical protein
VSAVSYTPRLAKISPNLTEPCMSQHGGWKTRAIDHRWGQMAVDDGCGGPDDRAVDAADFCAAWRVERAYA